MKPLRDKMAKRYTKANETAVAYVNDATPGIYSLNRNYSAYTIERVASDADFALFDERTVKRLIAENPELMPYYPAKRAVKRGIEFGLWEKTDFLPPSQAAFYRVNQLRALRTICRQESLQ